MSTALHAEVDALVSGHHDDPHRLLGVHVTDDGAVVRALKPLAASVTLVAGDLRVPLAHVHAGVWEAALDVPVEDYRLEVVWSGSQPQLVDDPWRHWPTVGDLDLHLVAEGRHERLWEVLGARQVTSGGASGTAFAVWAPGARGVRVTGDFNGWSGAEHPMRRLGGSGVWELFVPGLEPGFRYKFAILGPDGEWADKADPLARRTEVPPLTASVAFESGHVWTDDAWMAARTARPDRQPMSVYEVHLGSWRRHPDGSSYSYDELAEHLTAYVRELGFTHVELLPVMEHPFGGSWGYQVTSYYAPTARFGDPDGLRRLIDALHNAGVGVILDWVPAHFPKDAFALARFDGTPLYEHPDPRRGEHPDWGTYVFDFGRPEVRNFLVANALYWLQEFHADGLRVDAVASMLYLDYSREDGQWLPNVHGGRENLEAVQFLQELNATVYRAVPGAFTVAEESTSWPGVTRATDAGGLGFGFKWNMGWMHDTLQYFAHDPVHRSHHHDELTFSLVYAFSENFVLPLSHDEVVHGKGSLLTKMPGDPWRRRANLRSLLALQWSHPGKQLLFMGGELAQETEWAEQRELDWWLLDRPEHDGVRRLVADLNATYRATPALFEVDHDPAGFTWLEAHDAERNVLAFLRWSADGQPLAVVANLSAVPLHAHRVGLPAAGTWREVLNTDATPYGGSGVGNLGSVEAASRPWQGQPASADVVVPPLGVVWLTPVAAPLDSASPDDEGDVR
ncbi:1,4-alpha-glucan branching protein GlgB [Nocardioides jiangxiensis]|uniref:1,4-alpha-glucan branching enzyme GlgB n=1 Tax=Nocardioides jiangxiensis TaxID=3064524 RepID=A0ABT9B466_9ACTN|nr:1,4-alpha-glucan branching protein GlgB [Nocardioides sp. WY-20]MDO7868382.1 1,4-alpha-glucan branching protein GlgB [Nocardioides sp. WY-20]